MRIVVLLSRVPWPLEKGDKLRAYKQLEYLGKKHEVMICCLADSKPHPDALAELRKISPNIEVVRLNKLLIGWRMLRALVSDKPFQVHYFLQSAAKRRIQHCIEQFKPDHIYAQLIRTSEYVKNLHGYPKTLDYMDALSAGFNRRIDSSPWWLRPFVREEAARLLKYEHLIFDYFEHHTVISKQDQALIFHSQRERIAVIPNGVDTAFFTPQQTLKQYDLLFTGNMGYAPNVAGAEALVKDVLPAIWAKHPQVKLLIAGANPSIKVMRLASDRVDVSGWLPDIRKAYAESKIFVAPMFTGSGMQNKLLEAMSMGLPCITSKLAATALGVSDPAIMSIANDTAEFATKVIELLDSSTLQDELAAAGQKFVHDQFNWAQTVEQLEQVMQGSFSGEK